MLFASIPGHDDIKSRLIQTIRQNRVAHAQLFTGPRGAGILPMVRSTFMYLMCTERGEADACGTCPACKKNLKGIHPDVHFSYPVVTKESGKKVVSSDYAEAWRGFMKEEPFGDLRDWHKAMNAEKKQGAIHVSEGAAMQKFLSVKPFESKFRVLVVWQADKMNPDAANKLLKSLEEPPPNTFFFLISNEAEQMLDTILSRTQEVKIKPISVEDLQGLNGVNPEALTKAYLEKDRHLGNALKALNSGELVSNEWDEVFIDWMRKAYAVNVPALVDWSEKYGGQTRDWLKGFLGHSSRIVRDALMMQYQAEGAIPYVLESGGFHLSKFAKFVHAGNVQEIYEIFDEAIFHIDRNGNTKIILMDLSAKFTKLLRVKPEV